MKNNETPYAVDIIFNSDISNNPLNGLRGMVWSCNEGLATKKLIDTALSDVGYTVGNNYIKDMRHDTLTNANYAHEIERTIEVNSTIMTKGKDFKKYQEAVLANEIMEADVREGHKRENNFSYFKRAGLILDNFRSGKTGIIK